MINLISKIILTVIILHGTLYVNAQINAITDTGDEVILYQDGTWIYIDDSLNQDVEIPINETPYSKNENSTFLVKSTRLNVGIWINPKSWSFTKSKDDVVTEFQFQNKKGDLYGMLISEKIQIPLNTLKDIAIQNARSAAPDIKVIKEEYRTVNGIQVLMLEFSGTIQGIEFIYYGYYYSNSQGSTQFLAYTAKNLIDSKVEEIDKLLNGFVEL